MVHIVLELRVRISGRTISSWKHSQLAKLIAYNKRELVRRHDCKSFVQTELNIFDPGE